MYWSGRSRYSLEQDGFTVTLAADGRKAIERFRSDAADAGTIPKDYVHALKLDRLRNPTFDSLRASFQINPYETTLITIRRTP